MRPTAAEHYRSQGWWPERSVGAMVRSRAARNPEGLAYIGDRGTLSWAEYDSRADHLAARLAGLGLQVGDRVAVRMPDGPPLHVAYLACERAGLVIVGVPLRAGDREVDSLLRTTEASALICPPADRDRAAAEFVRELRTRGARLNFHVEVHDEEVVSFDWRAGAMEAFPDQAAPITGRELAVGDLWMISPTSGTTGLPKCVQQVQLKFMYMVRLAEEAANLGDGDVMMVVVPNSVAFGLWSAHMLPAQLGVPCVLRERFDATDMMRAIAEHRVTVLAAVTTQFLLMLTDQAFAEADLSSLRVLYTGGERIPPDRAREWEGRTGSTILTFYGSSEIGPLTYTRLADDADVRLSTVGRIVPGTECRLFDEQGKDVTASGGPAQPGGRGPGVFGGYWQDDEANAALFTSDGFLLMPDLVTVDEEGLMRVVGRKADIIIRGGKNLSAARIEEEVGSHPDIDLVAAVAVPDPVFGERVCAVVTLRNARRSLSLADLSDHLADRGVGKEYFPEQLLIVEDMPQSAGGKIAKSELKATIAARSTAG
ncbi:class I adenylate-forming enzyme family protein [Pseudonocardia sp. RS010]|uniref:class I adenylate-forming enzyme family protein n=1 Tax=Pseudonocardia sp. RS010 TaxID=3385979 RepID=UPI00399F21CA